MRSGDGDKKVFLSPHGSKRKKEIIKGEDCIMKHSNDVHISMYRGLKSEAHVISQNHN